MINSGSTSKTLRLAAVGAVTGLLAAAFYVAATDTGSRGVTAQQFVDLQQGGTPFAGFRRAHAKGLCVTGEFVSNGNLASYSVSGESLTRFALLREMHAYVAYGFILLLLMHIGGALYHGWVRQDGVLGSMLLGGKNSERD